MLYYMTTYYSTSRYILISMNYIIHYDFLLYARQELESNRLAEICEEDINIDSSASNGKSSRGLTLAAPPTGGSKKGGSCKQNITWTSLLIRV